ncbi:MAG: tetratricopeptide repeat protein [Candidatus Hydrogenedentes bacterium]|nr:tetratricopeptide repeat protein [Candidatus Hydrogenedentota bacterium]
MKLTRKELPNPRKILAVWSGGILLVLAVLGLYTLLLHSQVEALRVRSPWTYLKEAERLQGLNNSAAALRMLEKAQALAPDDPLPFERAGRIYYDTKEWQQALDAYTRALRLGSREIDVRGKAMWCMIRLGRNLEGAQFGEACVKEGLSTDSFYRYIAEAYRRAGKVPEATKFYEEARRKAPNDLAILQRLMEMYTTLSETKKAENLQQLLTDLESAP